MRRHVRTAFVYFGGCGSTAPTPKLPDLVRGRVPYLAPLVLARAEALLINLEVCDVMREPNLAILVAAAPQPRR